MKKKLLHHNTCLLSRTLILSMVALLGACSSSSDTNSDRYLGSSSSSSGETEKGFAAVINDFTSYEDWQVVDYAVGTSNPLMGGAHGGEDLSISRKTFMNELAVNSKGDFEQGAILVKEVFTYTTGVNGIEKSLIQAGGLVAMVKRGDGFNSENNGWEWFMLEPDLSAITAQGANLMGGACNGCHSKADSQSGGVDYVFPKPTEFIVSDDAFSDYTSWDLIEFNTTPSSLNGGAHIDEADLRRVYQKQVYANPNETTDWGYPVGTMLVKDITKDDEVQQVVAMVKRGGAFDEENGNWEYFMLDPSDPSKIVVNDNDEGVRGAIPMCIGCHASANGDLGTDFVFKHADTFFNTNTAGEFIANKWSLNDYSTWSLSDYALGASNAFLGAAHSNANEEFARNVFQNDLADTLSDEEYPVGSIIVKETFTSSEGEKVFAEMGGVLAMVKRGGEFNIDNNGWEWIMLSPSGDFLARGAELNGGACNACHSKASGEVGTDFTFKKPSEKISVLGDFIDYKNWLMIDEASGDSMANGGAHTASAVRRTYKYPASASPHFESQEYPVGTILVKEIINDGELSNIYGMVKRGGGFNPTHGDWQWFTIRPDLSQLSDLGTGSGCTGCHSKAGSELESDESFKGKDYVFFHQGDPVPFL